MFTQGQIKEFIAVKTEGVVSEKMHNQAGDGDEPYPDQIRFPFYGIIHFSGFIKLKQTNLAAGVTGMNTIRKSTYNFNNKNNAQDRHFHDFPFPGSRPCTG